MREKPGGRLTGAEVRKIRKKADPSRLSHGNPLDLYPSASKLPLHQAAIDLCQRLGREVPWIRRW